MNVSELVAFTKNDKKFREIDDDATKESRVVRALGWGVRYVKNLVSTHIDPAQYDQSFTLVLTGASSYALPTSCGVIRHVEDSDTRLVVEALTTRDRGRFFGDGSDLPSSDTVRVYYTPKWPELLYGTASSGSTTTMVLPAASSMTYGALSVRDDAYNGTKFEIVSGIGAGQILLVSDYVGSTRTLTVTDEIGGAITTAPDSTSVFSTYLGDIPPEFEPFVFDYALYWLTMQDAVLARLGNALHLTLNTGIAMRSRMSAESTDDCGNLSDLVYARSGQSVTFFRCLSGNVQYD